MIDFYLEIFYKLDKISKNIVTWDRELIELVDRLTDKSSNPSLIGSTALFLGLYNKYLQRGQNVSQIDNSQSDKKQVTFSPAKETQSSPNKTVNSTLNLTQNSRLKSSSGKKKTSISPSGKKKASKSLIPRFEAIGFGDRKKNQGQQDIPDSLQGKILKVGCGYMYTALLKDDNSVKTIGKFRSEEGKQVNFPECEQPAFDIACGKNHLVLLGIDHKAYAIGDNKDGQCVFDFKLNLNIRKVQASYLTSAIINQKQEAYISGSNYFNDFPIPSNVQGRIVHLDLCLQHSVLYLAEGGMKVLGRESVKQDQFLASQQGIKQTWIQHDMLVAITKIGQLAVQDTKQGFNAWVAKQSGLDFDRIQPNGVARTAQLEQVDLLKNDRDAKMQPGRVQEIGQDSHQIELQPVGQD